jgi:hypothetical protein
MISSTRLAKLLLGFVVLAGSVQVTAAQQLPGTLLWQDRFVGGEDPAALVAVSGDRVFVVGKGPLQPGADTGWLVKAYDAGTGEVLWTDAYSGFAGIENKGQTVTVGGGLVFAGGFVSKAASADEAMIRVYDEETGSVRWEDRFSYGASFASVNSVAVEEEKEEGETLVYAVGRGLQADFTTAWFVRAYDARTGVLVWKDLFHPTSFDDALSVAIDQGRVFVSGFTFDDTHLRHFAVRAYDGRTGSLLWQDVVPGFVMGFFGGDAAAQIVAKGNRVLAAGVITDATGYHFAVRAYETATGVLLWTDVVDTGNGLDSANSIALNGGRAFVVGQGGPQCSFDTTSDCDWLIRTYDQDTGALLWEKRVDTNHQDDNANVVLACGDRVVVAGGAGTDTNAPYSDWLVQVLDAKNGALVWENLLPTPRTFAVPFGLAVADNRLFVTGATSDIAGGTQNGDFIVRAHRFGVEEDDCESVSNNAGFR